MSDHPPTESELQWREIKYLALAAAEVLIGSLVGILMLGRYWRIW
jgi:hypothetical protein